MWVGGIALFAILFGVAAHKAPEVASNVFTPIDEFKLDTWFKLGPIRLQQGGPVSAAGRRHHDRADDLHRQTPEERPGRLQVAVESFDDFTRD